MLPIIVVLSGAVAAAISGRGPVSGRRLATVLVTAIILPCGQCQYRAATLWPCLFFTDLRRREHALHVHARTRTTATTRCRRPSRLGTDSNTAQVLVQNRVQLALPVIPDLGRWKASRSEVAQHADDRQTGSRTEKRPAKGRHLPDELRDDPNQRRICTTSRCRQYRLPGATRLHDAGLGRSRKDGLAGPLPPPTSSTPWSSRTSKSRPARSASNRCPRPAFPVYHEYPGPADRPSQFGDIIVKVGPASQSSALPGEAEAASTTSSQFRNASSSSAGNSQPAVTAGVVRLKDVARIELGTSSTTSHARSTPSLRWLVDLSAARLERPETAKAVSATRWRN